MVENRIENKGNEKFVVKVYVNCSEQLAGAVVCDNKDEAEQIAEEISELTTFFGDFEYSVKTQIEKITENFAGNVWREWAEGVERSIRYCDDYHPCYALNIITSGDYHKKGFSFILADYDKMVFENEDDPNNKDFLGWYDVFRDAVINTKGEIIAEYDDDGNVIMKEK